MKNRRTFIKKVAAAGIASSIPSILYPQQDYSQPISLIMRADDMANNWGITLGIIKAHKEGIVTSASIMVPSQFFDESVVLCKANPTLTVGIHITLVGTKTRSVLSPEIVPSILTPEGFFYEKKNQLNNANPKVDEMEKEIRAQIQKARASGLNFVYLDNHRSIPEIAREIIFKLCNEQQLVSSQTLSEYGYKRLGHNIESWPQHRLPNGELVYYPAPAPLNKEKQQEFFDLLMNLEPGERYMLNMHPGLAEPERSSVTELLCSSKTKEIIKMKNIQLVSHYDPWKEKYGKT